MQAGSRERGYHCNACIINALTDSGRLAQLVRAPALQAGGRRFESCTAHHRSSKTRHAVEQSHLLSEYPPTTARRDGRVSRLPRRTKSVRSLLPDIRLRSHELRWERGLHQRWLNYRVRDAVQADACQRNLEGNDPTQLQRHRSKRPEA